MPEDLTSAEQAEAFLQVWLEVRQLIQVLNFNTFQQGGVSATQFMILNLLEQHQTATSLARQLQLNPATVGRSLDSLERRGYIVRQRTSHNRREVRLSVTEAGKAMQNQSRGQFTAQIAALFSAMSAEGRAALLSGYREFAEQGRIQLAQPVRAHQEDV